MDIPCYVSTGTFNVGFNTTLTIRGGCEFVVNATSSITMEKNSTVQVLLYQNLFCSAFI